MKFPADMRKTLWKMIGCTVLLHLFCYPAYAQDTIDEIVIEGNRYVSESKILRIMRVRKGDRFDAQIAPAGISIIRRRPGPHPRPGSA